MGDWTSEGINVVNLYCSTALVALLMMLNAHDEQRKHRRTISIDQELVTTIDQRPAHASAEVFFTSRKSDE